MRRVQIALAAGLAITAATLGSVLSRSPLTVAATNSVSAHDDIGRIQPDSSFCQEGGTVPRGTTAVRASLSANAGPTVKLEVLSGSRLVTEGQRTAGWGIEETVTVPVRRVPRAVSHALVCVSVGPSIEVVQVNGSATQLASNRGSDPGTAILRLEYLRPGLSSWWSLASSIAYRMGLGRAPSGAVVAPLALVLMLAIAMLASRLILRELGITGENRARRGWPAWMRAHRLLGAFPPRAACICALIACVNAACWSLITPPFQAPDESSHFAYTQQLAQTGRIPTSEEAFFSPEEDAVMRDLHVLEVNWHPERRTISSAAEQQTLQQDLDSHLSRSGDGVGVAAAEPPLYYLLETLPYELASHGTLLDQLELMRLLSALMAGLTALFVFLFLREALPALAWTWTVGGLGVSLAPLLGFMSGTVNPDSMLYAVSAALFYWLARSFRRGLTARGALAFGAIVAVGIVTKLNFVGLLPGALAGLAVLTVRQSHRLGRSAYLLPALACAVAVSPVAVYAIYNTASGRPALGATSGYLAIRHLSLREISYIWQFYLPRLPGMSSYFPGLSSTYQLWFKRAVGLYGWLDTSFPLWVYRIAPVPVSVILALCIRALIAGRVALRARLIELMVYAAMCAGLLALVGASSYSQFPATNSAYAEPRYTLPLVTLLAAVLALAARGAGRRWGPAAGTLIVVLVLAYDIFSQLLVVSRFYG
jgi:branched-subunit amino acid transport protein